MRERKLAVKGFAEILSLIFIGLIFSGGFLLPPSLWWILFVFAFLITFVNWLAREKS